jgi:hypothetical protein
MSKVDDAMTNDGEQPVSWVRIVVLAAVVLCASGLFIVRMKHPTERPMGRRSGCCQRPGNSLAGRDAELFRDRAGAGFALKG